VLPALGLFLVVYPEAIPNAIVSTVSEVMLIAIAYAACCVAGRRDRAGLLPVARFNPDGGSGSVAGRCVLLVQAFFLCMLISQAGQACIQLGQKFRQSRGVTENRVSAGPIQAGKVIEFGIIDGQAIGIDAFVIEFL